MASSMISEGPRDSSYEDAKLAENKQPEEFERPKPLKPDYVLLVEDTGSIDSSYEGAMLAQNRQSEEIERPKSSKPDNMLNVKETDLGASQKSDSYISVSESDSRNYNMEPSHYLELQDICLKDETRNTKSLPVRSDGMGNKRPTLAVPPTVNYTENNPLESEDVSPYDELDDIGDCNDIRAQDATRDKPDRNKRRYKVCTVIVIIIIIGLVTAVSVLVYIVLENKDHQSPEPSSTVMVTTQSLKDPLNTTTSKIQKRDERESTANEELTTSGQKTSITPDIATTTPVQSTVKVPGYPKDCKEIRNSNITITNVYKIYPSSRSQAINVLCDMSRDNGGWTVFQRRFDGSVDFYRVWKSYKNGFGSVTGEHWLGNDILHQLTELGESILYVAVEDFAGKEYVAEYSNFTVADESDQYRFRISRFIGGNAGNAIEGWEKNNVNGIQFSTYDRDNDNAVASCAVARHGAWWYNECTMSNLNGRYPVDGGVCQDCNFWLTIFNDFIGMKKTIMMVRRK